MSGPRENPRKILKKFSTYAIFKKTVFGLFFVLYDSVGGLKNSLLQKLRVVDIVRVVDDSATAELIKYQCLETFIQIFKSVSKRS